MFKAGDVVLGSFATKSGVLRHYSVVLDGNRDGAMLVYTTSLKSPSESKQVFSNEDMQLAGWSNRCRWDASSISLVPNEHIEKVGRITGNTLKAITAAFHRATLQRSVVAVVLEKSGEFAMA